MAETPAPPLSGFRRAGRLALALLVLAIAALAFQHRATLDAAAIKDTLERLPAAPLIFIAAHVVASLIFFPRTVLGVAAGAVFGVWWGTLWSAMGSVLGAVAGFLLARYVNGGLIDLESRRRLGPLLLRAERGGWRAVAVLRLIPVIPHSLTNYALGLTRLDLAAYALGSLLGQLPMSIACADFGAAGESLAAGRAGWLMPTAVGLVVLGASALLPRLLARRDAGR